jgi:hypothetical protein
MDHASGKASRGPRPVAGVMIPAKEERTIDRADRIGLANLASHGFAMERDGNRRADCKFPRER